MMTIPSPQQVCCAVALFESKLGDFGTRPLSPAKLWQEAWSSATQLPFTPTVAAAASAIDAYGRLQHELNERQLADAWREIVELVPANGTRDVAALAEIVLCEFGGST